MIKSSSRIADEVFTKTAILDILGLGALSHMGTNTAVKALHKPLSGLRERALSKGMERGISGQRQSFGSRMRELWVGPETVGPEHAGKVVGGLLRDQPRGHQYRALKKLRKAVAMSPTVNKSPYMEDVVGGVNQLLKKPLPIRGPVQTESRLNRALPYLGVPALAAGGALSTHIPAAMVHAAINRTRLGVAGSQKGRNFMENAFWGGLGEAGAGSAPKMFQHIGEKKNIPKPLTDAAAGLAQQNVKELEQHGGNPRMHEAFQKIVNPEARPGPEPSRARNLAWDIAVSPAALDTERMGRNFGKSLHTPEGLQDVRRMAGATHNVVGNSRVQQVMRARGLEPGRPDPRIIFDLLGR
jgi:hypothetical protein